MTSSTTVKVGASALSCLVFLPSYDLQDATRQLMQAQCLLQSLLNICICIAVATISAASCTVRNSRAAHETLQDVGR